MIFISPLSSQKGGNRMTLVGMPGKKIQFYSRIPSQVSINAKEFLTEF